MLLGSHSWGHSLELTLWGLQSWGLLGLLLGSLHWVTLWAAGWYLEVRLLQPCVTLLRFHILRYLEVYCWVTLRGTLESP